MSIHQIRRTFCAAAFALAVAAADANAATYTVPGSSPTIQGAINLATSGDSVLVSPGTYHESIDFLGKNITLQSTGGAAVTTIVAAAMTSVVTIDSDEDRNAMLDGFTITGGQPGPSSPCGSGGGILIGHSSPTIINNVITGNTACWGGGLATGGGAPLISANTFSGNRADEYGGAMSLVNSDGALISGNRISGNTAPSGSAISLWAGGNPTIIDNVITGNIETGYNCWFDGGTIWMVNDSRPDIIQNIIASNVAACSGGVHFLVPSGSRGPALVNNTIALNGGSISGIFAEGFDAATPLVNNIVLAPPGTTAMYCADLYAVGPPVMQNNVFFSDGGIAASGFCGPQMGQNGNVAADPKFVAPATGDFHLYADSPAVDSGTSTDPLIQAVDLAGAPRVQDGNGDGVTTIDIGVYELPVPGPLAIQRAESVKVHGSTPFGLVLSLDPAAPSTEPRIGPAQKLVFTLNKAVNAATITVPEGAAIANGPTFAGVNLTVDLASVADQQYVTVALLNIAALDGQTGASGSVRIGYLAGDVNGSRVVAVSDLVLVNNQLGRPLTKSNFLSDVNSSGIITVLDKVKVNNALGHFLPAP